MQLPVGDRIVGTVGVDPRLEPHPGIPDLALGVSLGDGQFHGIPARHGHVDLPRAGADGVANRGAADVGDTGATLDQRNFLRGFDQSQTHEILAEVDHPFRGNHVSEFLPGLQGHVIPFDTEVGAGSQGVFHRTPEIIALPVGIDQVAAMTAPPRLPQVDVGGNGGAIIRSHNASVGAAETAIEKTRIVGDIVHGCEQHR